MGKHNAILEVLQIIVSLNVLKSKSKVLLVCINCSSVPKINQAKDILGEAVWAIHSKSNANSDFEVLSGLYVDLASIFAEQLNFSYHLIHTANLDEDINSLNKILNKSYAMTMFIISMTPSRIKYLDYTAPFRQEEVVFMIAASSNTRNSYFWLFRPFQAHLWLTTAAVIFIVLCFLKSTYTWNSQNVKNIGWFNLTFNFLFIKDQLNINKGIANKIVITTTYITCWLLFALYSGILTSYLTWDKPAEVTLMDLKDLNIKIGLYSGSSYEILMTSENDIFKSFKKRAFIIDENEIYLKDFCERKWAFHGSATYIKIFAKAVTKICTITLLKERAYISSNYFTVKKDDIFGKRVSKIIRKLHEYGIIARLIGHYHHKEKPDLDSSALQININHLKSLFCFMGIGICGALITLIIEMYYYKVSMDT